VSQSDAAGATDGVHLRGEVAENGSRVRRLGWSRQRRELDINPPRQREIRKKQRFASKERPC
jgi:hypothetical protein